MRILLLNGPNLNLLGEREPELYGYTTLVELEVMVAEAASRHGIELETFHSNHEGALIDRMHEARKRIDALIFNPGAFTHYSYALRDSVASIRKPMIEVHLSDPEKREEFRRVSVFAGLPNVRRIAGRGVQGYLDALELLAGELHTNTSQ